LTQGRYNIPLVPDIVPRQRLLSLLDRHENCRVFLVTGQAAQGKSTLVASFLRGQEQPSLWCHLTADASDHTRLFEILINGIHDLFKDQEQIQKIQIPQTTLGTREDFFRQIETLTMIFKQMASPLNIVLDDLESLDERGSCFPFVEQLIQENFGTVRFFLLSRTQPPLSFHQLKIRQDLMVINNEDLAFTLDETLTFFRATLMGVKEVERILKITEGWAGGLILVSESIRWSHDLEKLPHRLSSEAFSYFSREIYNFLPSATRLFLMQTAVFDVLDTQMLTNFFTDIDPLVILRELEKRNLFIQKIDSDSQWPMFKFNNLFRDFLKADLFNTLDKKAYGDLHEKVGKLFWERNAHEEALRFFIVAKAYSDIARIIRIKGIDYVITGRSAGLAECISVLPREMVDKDPWLIFFDTMTRRIKGGEKNIRTFGKALEAFKTVGDDRGILLCTAYLIEAAVFIRKPSQVILTWIRAGEACLKKLKGKHRYTWARTLLWQQIGLGYIAGNGDIPKGISACRNAILLAKRIENPDLLLNASVILTLGFVQSGDFTRSREMLEKIRDITQEGRHPEYRALKNITKIDYALKKGELTLAGTLLETSERDIEKFGLIFLYPGFVEARGLYFVSTGQFTQALQTADHLSDFSILEGNDFYLGISHRIKAMSFLREKKYNQAKEAALLAVNELGLSKRGDIHTYLARQIHGFSLFYTGDFAAAQRELEAVLVYFRRIASDLNFCETSFILGLISLGIKAESKDKDKNKNKGDIYLTAGIQKAMENHYTYFPLLDSKTLAQVLVQINLIPSGRTLSPGTLENQDLAPYLVSLVSRDLAPHILDEIIQTFSFGNKRERARRTEQLKPLYKLAQPKIRINTLGEFNVRMNDIPLDKSVFEGAKPISLLKAIVMNGSRDIPKEILIDALWPDASASAGEKNFKINLHRLRKGLEPSPVKEFGYAYVLQKSGLVSLDLELICLDIDVFMALGAEAARLESGNKPDEALACYIRAALVYKGDYFVEEPYLEWLGPRRELFRSKYIEILEKKGMLHEALHQWQEAVDTWRAILGTDPFVEAAYRNLMILYADAGRKNEALHVFKECQRILKRELDTEPEFQTQQIYARIKKL
jgi:LuxR family maltose regulon positive regulatory protein